MIVKFKFILITVFICSPFTFATKPASKNTTNKIIKKVSSKLNAKRKTATKNKKKSLLKKSTKRKLSQYGDEDLLRKNIYKEFDSKIIRLSTEKHINSIRALCKNNKSKKEKLDIVRENLVALDYYSKDLVDNYRLKRNDRIYLLNIGEYVDSKFVSYKKPSSTCEDIRDEFHHHYNYYNKIGENTPLNSYPHSWATSLIKGLNCSCK